MPEITIAPKSCDAENRGLYSVSNKQKHYIMRLFRTDRRGNPIPWFQCKRPSRRHPHLPQLFYLVLNRNWEGVVHRARSHPHEITEQEDVTGNTALHIACRLDPSQEAVQAMIEASWIPNSEGAIPLHIAATHRVTPQVIKVLLEKDSSGCSPTSVLTRMGRAPIHYACFSFRGLSLPAFQMLMEATLQSGHVHAAPNDLEDLMEDDECSQFDAAMDEETAPPKLNVVTLRDSSGQTPMGLLFRRYRERVRAVIQSMERLHPLAAALRVQGDLGELWDKARWIVNRLAREAKPSSMDDADIIASPGEQAISQEAAKWATERFLPSIKIPLATGVEGRRQRRRYLPIVHASVSLTGYGCPPEMIRLALSIHPHQIKEMDDEGCLPIHRCAMAPSLVFNDSGRNDDDCSFISEFSMFSQTTTQSTPMHPFDKVFKILLQHYPAAARVPHGTSGKLPLILALKCRSWEDGIQTLLDAYPPALTSRRWCVSSSLSDEDHKVTKSTSTTCDDSIYPYLFARIGNRSSLRKSQNAIYELLKAKPDLLKPCERLQSN